MIKFIFCLVLVPFFTFGQETSVLSFKEVKLKPHVFHSYSEVELLPLTDSQKILNEAYLKNYDLNMSFNDIIMDSLTQGSSTFGNELSDRLGLKSNAAMISGGTGIGNGGDMILCPGKPAQFLDNYIAQELEASLGRSFAGGLWALRKVKSIKALEETYQLFFKVDAEVALEFEKFINSYLSHYSGKEPSGEYIWVRDTNNILLRSNVPDENLEFTIDKSCELKQLFIRINKPIIASSLNKSKNMIIFNTDLMSQLSLENTQLSFALTHEFLWNYIQRKSKGEFKKLDSRVIRGINYFLHSTLALSLSNKELREQIRKLGFKLSSTPELKFDVSNYTDGNYYEKYVMISLAVWEQMEFISTQIKLEYYKNDTTLVLVPLIERGVFLGVKTLDLSVLEGIIDLMHFSDGINRFESVAMQLISYTGPVDYYRAIRENKKIWSFISNIELHRELAMESGAHPYQIMGVFMRLSNLRHEILLKTSE